MKDFAVNRYDIDTFGCKVTLFDHSLFVAMGRLGRSLCAIMLLSILCSPVCDLSDLEEQRNPGSRLRKNNLLKLRH